MTYSQYLISGEYNQTPDLLLPFDKKTSIFYNDPFTMEPGTLYPGYASYNIHRYPGGGKGPDGQGAPLDKNDLFFDQSAILGNGEGSLESFEAFVYIDDGPSDALVTSSWTLSCLARDTLAMENNSGWTRQHSPTNFDRGVLAAMPFYGSLEEGFSYPIPGEAEHPYWEMALNAHGADENAGQLFFNYVLAEDNVVSLSGGDLFEPGSHHVFTIRYDSATLTMSTWVDGVKQAEQTLASDPGLPLYIPSLCVATSTVGVATSHWAYWTSAIPDSKITEAANIAMAGGYVVPDNPWDILAQKGSTGAGLNVKGDWS